MKRIFKIVFVMTLMAFTNCFANQETQNLNQDLLTAMKAYHVPVVGYAIIKNYKIISADTLSIDPNLKVSPNTLFQAASISKSISAYGALKLISQNKLYLDASVNDFLTSWKIPFNDYNRNDPVTVRQLLDMTSGLSVSGFPGYVKGEQLPNLLQILNGQPPANTPPIKVFYKPGSKYFYSGGAFEVLEQLIENITQQSFSPWMQKEILESLDMGQSIYEYPLSESLSTMAVPGFLLDGTEVKGGWNNYAVMSAGGLWSTPMDLAKFAINISNAYRGKNNTIITQAIAQQMLTRQKNTDYGLGVVVNGNGKNLNFRKAGHNLGYHSQLIMFPNTGDGAIIMTNSENGEYIINYLLALISQEYHWPCYFPHFDELIVIPEKAC